MYVVIFLVCAVLFCNLFETHSGVKGCKRTQAGKRKKLKEVRRQNGIYSRQSYWENLLMSTKRL